jgi:hypothetical protein
LKPEKGWQRRFDDPIPLPRGRPLVTLKDAGRHITKLPKDEHEAAEWQVAMEALILVSTLGGPSMFARIGVMRALNPSRRARVRPGPQRASLGTAQASARPLKIKTAIGVRSDDGF